MLVFDTICALATPPYKSALAIIRLSGEKTLDILSHIMKKDISTIEANHAYLIKIYKDKSDDSTFVDECMMTFYKGPKSYTGFDSADFTIHGSTIIMEELLDVLCLYGARRALQGEFSAQSYFNGKMDLLKAEGINDLINAASKRAKMLASKTLSGKNTEMILDYKNRILGYLAMMEYYIENTYDDGTDDYLSDLEKIRGLLSNDVSELNNLIDKTKIANKQYTGFKVAIAGLPNVGKSTLLNSILKEDKAIVSSIPGTTRDVVEGSVEIKGIRFDFKDTAGIHESDDYVETLGIEKSIKTIKDADLVILASDSDFSEFNALSDILKDKRTLRVQTKNDLHSIRDDADISLSYLSDVTPLLNKIHDILSPDDKENSLFLGKREEEYLIRIRDSMQDSIRYIEETHEIDIVSDTLRKAISAINEMMGKSENKTMEDIYETLFSKFCLGK